MLFSRLSKILCYTIKQTKFLSNQKMSKHCQVAVCQFTATADKQNNLNIIKTLINKAVNQNAQIVFLPEAVDFIASSTEQSKSLSEPLNGNLMNEYRKLAKDNGIWLSIGGFHEIYKESIYNSHILIDKNGDIASIYRKVHLFDVSIPEENIDLRESNTNQRGSQIIGPINTPAGSLALAICYDLRFPELSVIQRKLGAEILTYPSAFTHATGFAHWEVLLRARAIENQCYVVAAAQYGEHNEKRTSFGHSLIIDPWGNMLAECPKYSKDHPTNESIAVADIDLEKLTKIRRNMPVLEHRRNDLYSLNLLDNKPLPINDEEVYFFADKKIPGSTIFYKTKFSFAFTNIRCVVPGHVLISSLRYAKRLEDLTEQEVEDMFKTVVKVEKVLEKVHQTSSSTIVVQDGSLAGQTVPHVHVHILPRQKGDFTRNDDIYDTLAKHDREDNPTPLRSICEMSNEALTLRKYFYTD